MKRTKKIRTALMVLVLSALSVTQSDSDNTVGALIGKQFTTFEELLEVTGLLGATTAISEDIHLTVFVPSDEAFEVLKEYLTALLQPEYAMHLKELLKYHMINEVIHTSDMAQLQRYPFETIIGDEVWFRTNDTSGEVSVLDTMGAPSLITLPDQKAANGIFHGLNRVLLPSWFGSNLLDRLQNSDDDDYTFSIFMEFLEAADMTEVLRNQTFTLLAPTDEAFEDFGDRDLDFDDEALKNILLYHQVEGVVPTTMFEDGGALATLVMGAETSIVNGTIFIDAAEVVRPDLVANNGIIHGINAVLVPYIYNEGEEL